MPRAKRLTPQHPGPPPITAENYRHDEPVRELLEAPKPGEKFAARKAQKQAANNALADMLELFNPFRFL